MYILNTTWYRGYTTNTLDNQFIWITSDEELAKEYTEINYAYYGGEKITKMFNIDISKLNILDLAMYDMDECINEYDMEEFLSDVNIEMPYSDIELFMGCDDLIPLSRLVNSLLDKLITNYDGLVIMESDKATVYINKNLIIK